MNGGTQHVAVKGERLVMVVDGQSAVGELEIHADYATGRPAGLASPFLTGRVKDLNRAKQFYGEGLGCPVLRDQGEFVSLSIGDGSSALALYQWDALAADAGVAADGGGFRGFTLSAIVGSPERVGEVFGAGRTCWRKNRQASAGRRVGRPLRLLH